MAAQIITKFPAVVLGRVDGFCPDKGASKGDEGGEVLCGFLTAQRDPLEALELANGLLDAGAAFIESAGKELVYRAVQFQATGAE